MKSRLNIAAAFFLLYLTVAVREGLTSADTEHVEDVLKTHLIKKRNAWWSKKSVNDDDESADQSVIRYAYLQRQPLQKPTPAELACYRQRCLANRRACEESWISTLLNDCQTKTKLCVRKCFTRKTGSSGPDDNTPNFD